MSRETTLEKYYEECSKRFGTNLHNWKFVCPVCGHVQSVQECRGVGMPLEAIAFSCIGRWTGAGPYQPGSSGPCNYAGGGLFRLNPVYLTDTKTTAFELAPAEPETVD